MNIEYNKSSFNWLAVLKDLRAGAPLNQDEHLRLMQYARSWHQCACAQLVPTHLKNDPGDGTPSPKDGKLVGLGQAFSIAIACKKWDKAVECCTLIQQRVEVLSSQNA